MDRKRQATAKAKAKEDRISDLPDCIIHHILSFLPSTKQAIQTSILSKQWLNQWTHVPVLIFNEVSTDISPENFVKFIDNSLIRHKCSKIKKFRLHYPHYVDDPQFDAKILFATQKHVEELYLSSDRQEDEDSSLPQFLFNNASSLVTLTAFGSTLMPDRKVNWGCLTALTLEYCELTTDQALQHILSGSPLLEVLKIDCCDFHNLVVASNSLKKLVVYGYWPDDNISAFEISCPNLVELSLVGVEVFDANLFAQMIENVLSTSSLLESFELDESYCPVHHLVIASKSLKRLVLSLSNNILNLHVSCPLLELFVLDGAFNLRTAKLLDLPSSLCATFDCHHHEEHYDDDKNSIRKTLVQDILQQLHHVKQLTFGRVFIKILSTLGVGDPFPSVLNLKSLTLNSPNLNNHYSGIARVLRHAPELEKRS